MISLLNSVQTKPVIQISVEINGQTPKEVVHVDTSAQDWLEWRVGQERLTSNNGFRARDTVWVMIRSQTNTD